MAGPLHFRPILKKLICGLSAEVAEEDAERTTVSPLTRCVSVNTLVMTLSTCAFNPLPSGRPPAPCTYEPAGNGLEGVMQMAITFMAVIGGLAFSLAVALLAEELIFGQIFRIFFAPRRLVQVAIVKSERKG